MKLVSVSCVRNEADILETFVRYHATKVDMMVIADNESTDGSLEMLQKLRSEGLPVHIETVSGTSFPQSEILMGLIAKAAALFDPDWILPLDADEFLRGDMAKVLSEHLPISLPWKTYVPTPDDTAHPNILARVTHRKAQENPAFNKVMIPRAVFRHPAFALSEGSHFVRSPVVGAQSVPGLCLAHFPVRSCEQIRRKVLENYARRMAVPGKPPDQSYHLKILADQLRDRTDISSAELQHIAASYAARGPVDESLILDPLEMIKEPYLSTDR